MASFSATRSLGMGEQSDPRSSGRKRKGTVSFSQIPRTEVDIQKILSGIESRSRFN
jgi:hypothetical protein